MANESDEVQTTVVAGTTDDVSAQIAAIEAEGGSLISVQLTSSADSGEAVEVEITHT
jgi:hypothetical protein